MKVRAAQVRSIAFWEDRILLAYIKYTRDIIKFDILI